MHSEDGSGPTRLERDRGHLAAHLKNISRNLFKTHNAEHSGLLKAPLNHLLQSLEYIIFCLYCLLMEFFPPRRQEPRKTLHWVTNLESPMPS